MNKPMLSFVIPCYRSEHTIGAVVKELTDTLSTRSEYEYEIVLVNDGSPDNTAGALEALSREVPRVVFVDLSRNFGQHSALMAGFHQVRGRYRDLSGRRRPDPCRRGGQAAGKN